MSFNNGWLCPDCGPMKDGKKKTINKKQHTCCKECGHIMKPWERPLKERPGRCSNCGHGKFSLAMYKKEIINQCKQCKEVKNPDTGAILKKGVN